MNKNVKTEQRQETEATVKIYRNKERTDYLYDPEEEKLGKKPCIPTSALSIIIIVCVLAIAGLAVGLYLIFRDDDNEVIEDEPDNIFKWLIYTSNKYNIITNKRTVMNNGIINSEKMSGTLESYTLANIGYITFLNYTMKDNLYKEKIIITTFNKDTPFVSIELIDQPNYKTNLYIEVLKTCINYRSSEKLISIKNEYINNIKFVKVSKTISYGDLKAPESFYISGSNIGQTLNGAVKVWFPEFINYLQSSNNLNSTEITQMKTNLQNHLNNIINDTISESLVYDFLLVMTENEVKNVFEKYIFNTK